MDSVPMPNSQVPRTNTIVIDTPYKTMFVDHIIAQPIQALTVWGSHRRWRSSNRPLMYGAAPLAVMSSVPSTTSPRNPKVSAEVARTAFHQGTAMLCSTVMPNMARTVNTATVRPTIQLSRASITRMPMSRPPLATTLIIIAEKKLESDVTSPSIRSMSSPGDVPLWNPMSSRIVWLVSSDRSWLVAVQPMSSAR